MHAEDREALSPSLDLRNHGGKISSREVDNLRFHQWIATQQGNIKTACSAPGSLDTSLSYAAWRSLCASRASIGV